MGNSESKSSSNSNSNSKPSTRGEGELEETPEQKRVLAEVRKIEASLSQDDSEANRLAQFTKVLNLEGTGSINCVTQIVTSMGEEWNNIVEDEYVKKYVKPKQMQELKDTRHDYFMLLMKTNKEIACLVQRCIVQKRFSSKLIDIAQKAVDKKMLKLPEYEQALYENGLRKLFRWIDQKELLAISDEWAQLCKRIEAQKTNFEKMYKRFNGLPWYGKLAIGLGAVICLGAFITLCVASHGAIIVVAGALCVTAEVLVGAGLAYGRYLNALRHPEYQDKIQKIIDTLENFCYSGKKINLGIGKLGATVGKIKGQCEPDAKYCETILPSLQSIDQFLADYIEEGNTLENIIHTACREFVYGK